VASESRAALTAHGCATPPRPHRRTSGLLAAAQRGRGSSRWTTRPSRPSLAPDFLSPVPAQAGMCSERSVPCTRRSIGHGAWRVASRTARLSFLKKRRPACRSTEVERLVVQRVGQDVFRSALMDYWGGRCLLTGISDPALLRASHTVGWAECDDDAHRLDVHNGLLLSALWDAAFDAGLISFTDDGKLLTAAALSAAAKIALHIETPAPAMLSLTASHRANMRRHRARYGF
jgi:hypothetical protein